jgi:uncharacterized protein (DUF305 family)
MNLLTAVIFACFLALSAFAQQPVIVQPGAPGQPTRVLPPDTHAVLPPMSAKDVEFMQGMILHHAQAVEMVDLLETRTENKAVRLLGERIRHSQSDEMIFMKRWLVTRGKPVSMPMPDMPGMDMPGHHHHQDHSLMPGMLNAKQMEALKNSSGAEFDRLFLTGMIQHHGGALTMVKDLFEAAGAGQDAELFNFATDVDSGQRAEIRVMEKMLKEIR